MRAMIRFGKQPRLRFISHLDLQRFFQRALNRTGLPVAYSQGFNPHPLMSFGSALALGLAFDTIAVSGTNSSRPHGVPRPVKLEKGFLTMDFGARLDGYCSDMTRTVVLGRADEDIKKVYNTVLLAQTVALEAAAEGVSCYELDAAARNVIHGAGYKGCFGHSLGHGVGMFVHEEPRLSPKADKKDVLERGHVVTFEPGIYIEGKYGCRIEDMAAVCNDGSIRNFTKSPKELIELF